MNRPNLLFLPGWGFDADIWQPLAKKLTNEAELHYLDWQRIESPEEISKRVEEWLKDKNDVTLIGWSLGALAALDAAKKFPGKITRIILFSATSCFTRREGYDYGWDFRVVRSMKRRLQKDQEGTLRDFQQMIFSSEEKMSGWGNKSLTSLFKDKNGSSLLHGLDYLQARDCRESLATINQPILLVHGEKDVICPLSASEYIAKHAGGKVTLERFSGVGHLPFHTEADKCFNLVRGFIAGAYDD
jgi:pimeloyl-[acyl-carrier protein] methyl ester esterase